MKTIFGIIAIISLLFVSSAVYAEDATQAEQGAIVEFAGANVGAAAGTPMTFTPSPSTSMLCSTATRDYNVLSWSANNYGEETGMVYFVFSGFSGVMQALIGDEAPDDIGTPGTLLTDYTPKK